jgi:citrate synthase
VAQAVTAEARRRALPEPNIDFALAVLAAVAGQDPRRFRGDIRGRPHGGLAGTRRGGNERDTPIRPRGIYTGPAAAAP